MNIKDIAKVCHEANKLLCESQGDFSQVDWWDSPNWQRDSAINQIKFHLANPDAGDSASHDAWMIEKTINGWIHGETKDAELKTHPCMVPFEQLPLEQQAKDTLFRSIVNALKPLIGTPISVSLVNE